MDAIIALLVAYAARAAKAAADAAELAHPTTWVCGAYTNATADAYNAELDSVASEASKAYYTENPDGHWDDAYTMQTAILALRVTAPRECGGFATY